MRVNFFVFIVCCFLLCSCGKEKEQGSLSSEQIFSEQQVFDQTKEADSIEITDEEPDRESVREVYPGFVWIDAKDRIYDADYLVSSLGPEFVMESNAYGNTYRVIYDGMNCSVACDLFDKGYNISYVRSPLELYFVASSDMADCVYSAALSEVDAEPCNVKAISHVSADLELFLNISLDTAQYVETEFVETKDIDGVTYDVVMSDLDENYYVKWAKSRTNSEKRETYWYIGQDSGRCEYLEAPLYDLYGNEVRLMFGCYNDGYEQLDSYVKNLHDSFDECHIMPYKLYAQRDLVERFAVTPGDMVGDCFDIIDNFAADNIYLKTVRDEHVSKEGNVDPSLIDMFYGYYQMEPLYVKDLLYEYDVTIHIDSDNSFDSGGTAAGEYFTDYCDDRNIYYDASSRRNVQISVNHEIGHFMDDIIFKDYYDNAGEMIDDILMVSHTRQFADIFEAEYNLTGWHLSKKDPAEFFAEIYRFIIEGNEHELSKAPVASSYVKDLLQDVEDQYNHKYVR